LDLPAAAPVHGPGNQNLIAAVTLHVGRHGIPAGNVVGQSRNRHVWAMGNDLANLLGVNGFFLWIG